MLRRSHLALGLLLFTACGDNTGAVNNFIDGRAQAQCDWIFRCCTDPQILQLHGHMYSPSDPSQCVPYEQLKLEDELYINRLAVKEGRMRVDGAASAACLDKFNTRLCDPKPGMPLPPVDPNAEDPCDFVFVGNTGIGSECIYQNECVRGAHCVSAGAGRGVCVPYQQESEVCNVSSDCDPKVKGLYCAGQDYKCHFRSKLGEPCAYTTDTAGANPRLPMLLECDNSLGTYLYCDSTSRTCKALPGVNQNCLSPIPPGVGDGCSNDPALNLCCDTNGGAPGICRGPGQLNDSCSSCGATECVKGLYCDNTLVNPICKALPGFGQDCATPRQCQMPYYCAYDNVTLRYTCEQPASVNEPCDPFGGGIRCDTDLYCDNALRVCKYKLQDGTPCTSSIQCLSSLCQFTPNGQVCVPGALNTQCVGR